MSMSVAKKETTLPTWAIALFSIVQTLITGIVTYMGNQAANDVKYEKLVAQVEYKIQATNNRIDLLTQELRGTKEIIDVKMLEQSKEVQIIKGYIGTALRPEEPDARKPKRQNI